jgi:hypothetical protein
MINIISIVLNQSCVQKNFPTNNPQLNNMSEEKAEIKSLIYHKCKTNLELILNKEIEYPAIITP